MRTVLLLCVATLLCLPATVLSHNGGILATAVPVDGIVIDGRLDDWPEEIEWYLIALNSQLYGPTDLDGQDLRHSHDLSARFAVGYNSEKNLIYLSVQVQDDALVYSPQDPWHTDACEIYMDGAHRGITVPLTGDATSHADLQYLICPGDRTWAGTGNPGLFGGNIGLTRTTGAWVRHGHQTVYELALEAFDRYPDARSVLTPGKVLGFDLTVVDKDSQEDTPAWICWTPGELKFVNGAFLGDLVLGEQRASKVVAASVLPDKVALADNYPNPFNLNTTIRFQLPRMADVRLEIYDMTGQRVRMLVQEELQTGRYVVLTN